MYCKVVGVYTQTTPHQKLWLWYPPSAVGMVLLFWQVQDYQGMLLPRGGMLTRLHSYILLFHFLKTNAMDKRYVAIDGEVIWVVKR